jgi:hypothetical protein
MPKRFRTSANKPRDDGLRRILIYCDAAGRRVRIGYISLQSDGSISFGLTDATYISPAFKVQHHIWNAYNRINMQYTSPSDPEALERVTNPHFTFHPPAIFQLTSRTHKGKNALFRGIADIGVTLHQQGEMPWLRATTAPLSQLPSRAPRADKIPTVNFGLAAPTENASVIMSLDFVPNRVRAIGTAHTCFIPWKGFVTRLTLELTAPQKSTLSWFHSY